MECSEKPVWTDFTKEALRTLQITAPNEKVRRQVQKNWDMVAKPLDGMGSFETLTAQIGAIQGTDQMDISKKAVIIMCADNGIVEEGISQSGQEVTAAVAEEMVRRESSVCKMAAIIGADIFPVDIGINRTEPIPGMVQKKVRCGTRNFRKEPAMTEEETVRAILAGIDMVAECKCTGYSIVATGEMGIGNTTTSSAVTAALLRCAAEKVTGRGAGLSDEKLVHKQQVIADAIGKYDLHEADAFEVLKMVGGLDIAGLTGVCIGGALFHIPVVLDGVISLAAALLAERLVPGVKAYLLPSHKGKEPAVTMLLQKLELEPVIDGRLALGEGTGAVMMLALLDMTMSVYGNRTTFADIQVEQYQRYADK
ncbi:MAG: nicotinate-nucleotide--dimethylbenzimidazole phosphoribosyltransferase [Lachnospiraceae bacterium]|nr:nicotinate-nucleotide--dimethylbenzimidazole phosphoribosyltransferase [Lachnospiraceae bacterium]